MSRAPATPPPAGSASPSPTAVKALARSHDATSTAASRPAYPVTRRAEATDTLHGIAVPDPYRWLEDEKSPGVKRWMAAQDALARSTLAALPGRAELAARAKELLYVEGVGLPVRRGGRLFWTRRAPDAEKAVLLVQDPGSTQPRVLLDPNGWSKDGSVSLGDWSPSWDGRRIAYQVKRNNSDEAVLELMDVATRRVSAMDRIEGGRYAHASWTPAGDGFYYTWLPTDPAIAAAERPGFQEVRFHRVGTSASTDTVVRQRTGDATAFLSASLSRDGHWLFLTLAHGWTATDVWFRDARAGLHAPWRPLAVGRKAIFEPWAFRDRFYVRTNEGAARWRLVEVDPARPEPERWREVVPESPVATLESFAVVGGRFALGWLERASSRLEVRELDGRVVRTVPLPAIGTVSGVEGEEDVDEAFFAFESFTYPRELRAMSVASGASRLWFRLRVPVDPSRYELTQVSYPSKDGTPISMFIVRAKGAPRDGSQPLLLTGYGGFQVPMTPGFRASLFPWLERGGAYALPNLRGGSEYGEAWHAAGMREKKQNVFDDFIAAAEWLVREGYTRSDRLVLSGGSNGGLLVGAAETQRPELFRVVLCHVPLLDMVRYHLFGAGRTWIEEYGSADDPALFPALLAYSPYHHVVPGTRYPATLVLSADADDRVDPMHARKFAAALQAASSGGPVLLRIERHSGHGGADLLRAEVEKIADQYAFALSEISRAAPEPAAAAPPGK